MSLLAMPSSSVGSPPAPSSLAPCIVGSTSPPSHESSRVAPPKLSTCTPPLTLCRVEDSISSRTRASSRSRAAVRIPGQSTASFRHSRSLALSSSFRDAEHQKHQRPSAGQPAGSRTCNRRDRRRSSPFARPGSHSPRGLENDPTKGLLNLVNAIEKVSQGNSPLASPRSLPSRSPSHSSSPPRVPTLSSLSALRARRAKTRHKHLPTSVFPRETAFSKPQSKSSSTDNSSDKLMDSCTVGSVASSALSGECASVTTCSNLPIPVLTPIALKPNEHPPPSLSRSSSSFRIHTPLARAAPAAPFLNSDVLCSRNTPPSNDARSIQHSKNNTSDCCSATIAGSPDNLVCPTDCSHIPFSAFLLQQRGLLAGRVMPRRKSAFRSNVKHLGRIPDFLRVETADTTDSSLLPVSSSQDSHGTLSSNQPRDTAGAAQESVVGPLPHCSNKVNAAESCSSDVFPVLRTALPTFSASSDTLFSLESAQPLPNAALPSASGGKLAESGMSLALAQVADLAHNSAGAMDTDVSVSSSTGTADAATAAAAAAVSHTGATTSGAAGELHLDSSGRLYLDPTLLSVDIFNAANSGSKQRVRSAWKLVASAATQQLIEAMQASAAEIASGAKLAASDSGADPDAAAANKRRKRAKPKISPATGIEFQPCRGRPRGRHSFSFSPAAKILMNNIYTLGLTAPTKVQLLSIVEVIRAEEAHRRLVRVSARKNKNSDATGSSTTATTSEANGKLCGSHHAPSSLSPADGAISKVPQNGDEHSSPLSKAANPMAPPVALLNRSSPSSPLASQSPLQQLLQCNSSSLRSFLSAFRPQQRRLSFSAAVLERAPKIEEGAATETERETGCQTETATLELKQSAARRQLDLSFGGDSASTSLGRGTFPGNSFPAHTTENPRAQVSQASNRDGGTASPNLSVNSSSLGATSENESNGGTTIANLSASPPVVAATIPALPRLSVGAIETCKQVLPDIAVSLSILEGSKSPAEILSSTSIFKSEPGNETDSDSCGSAAHSPTAGSPKSASQTSYCQATSGDSDTQASPKAHTAAKSHAFSFSPAAPLKINGDRAAQALLDLQASPSASSAKRKAPKTPLKFDFVSTSSPVDTSEEDGVMEGVTVERVRNWFKNRRYAVKKRKDRVTVRRNNPKKKLSAKS